MTGLRSLLGRGAARLAFGAIAVVAAAALMAPLAGATPESDATDAINQAWQAAGGDGSPVGAPDGDVYAVGEGFGRNFSGGKIFFTPSTGAHLLYGPVLDKYTELGGPADSDLGFPTIDVVTGLVGPDSRVSTFSAGDKPVIFWTPSTGAWVVRGAINAGWDQLGGSAGALGVPVADETYNGDVVSQKFSGGELSWNASTKAFTTVPPELAGNLTGVEVPSNATAAIDQAWRAAGGLSGPLGARQGDQSSIGDNGAAQSFAGGKIFYSPATGAHAVTGAILSKYESMDGPTGELGFPIAAEADGGAPNSRVSAFSAADKPVIFWTPDNGAIVVRGAINAAWGKLGGATGALGVPTGEQKVDGDTVTQSFSGGELSWNSATKTFTSKPPSLASSLSGVEVPDAGAPRTGAGTAKSDNAFKWRWWWLLVIIPILLLIGVLALGILWLQRRRAAAADFEPGDESEFDDGERWSAETTGGQDLSRYGGYSDAGDVQVEQPSGSTWSAVGAPGKTMPGPEDVFDGDLDSIDTTPTRIPVEESRHDGDVEAVEAVEPSVETPEAPRAPEAYVWAQEESTTETAAPAGAFAEEIVGEVVEEHAEEDVAEEERVDSGRHAAVNIDESPSMWRLDMDEIGVPRRRRSADDDEPAVPFVETAEEAFADVVADVEELPAAQPQAPPAESSQQSNRPAIHLPLADPYQAPEGYVIKATTHSGLYYTPDSLLYEHTLPEVWFASEELAQANGFVKAPE